MRIVGRQEGSWFLSLLDIDPTVQMVVTEKNFHLEKRTLFGYTKRTIPISRISEIRDGFEHPWLLPFIVCFFGSLPALLLRRCEKPTSGMHPDSGTHHPRRCHTDSGKRLEQIGAHRNLNGSVQEPIPTGNENFRLFNTDRYFFDLYVVHPRRYDRKLRRKMQEGNVCKGGRRRQEAGVRSQELECPNLASFATTLRLCG